MTISRQIPAGLSAAGDFESMVRTAGLVDLNINQHSSGGNHRHRLESVSIDARVAHHRMTACRSDQLKPV
jgi:hypothetical protein